MLQIKDDEIRRWQAEIGQAEDFRDKEFGTYRLNGKLSKTDGAGRNLDYYEFGGDSQSEEYRRALNIAFILTKNIVPLLFPQNPKALSLPTKKQYAESAPYAAALINHYIELLNLKETDQQVVFDAYTLGFGVSKKGYATEFGADALRTKSEEDKRLRDKIKERTKKLVDDTLVQLGVKQPKEEEEKEETPLVDVNEFIISENPYIRWVDPFNFLIDCRARSVFDAWWVGEKYRKTIWEVKQNPRYSKEKNDLKATALETDSKIPDTQIEKFQTVDLYEVHYKNPDSPTGITILVLAMSEPGPKVLFHEHSTYKMRGWQYELLAFNKHNHRLYPISDLTLIRPLIDRINVTFEAILEQVDKYVSKIFYDKNKMTPEGENQLRTGEIGAMVAVDGNPNEAVRVAEFAQLKQDMVVLLEKLIDLIILHTGLTRAQLTGLTTAQTATESQIGQAGSNNRRTDQNDSVLDFLNRQVDKLWSVIAQFVDLEQVQLLTGETEYDDESGLPKFAWLPEISPELADTLRNGEYRFNIEMTSVQRPNLEILRKQVENLIVVLTNPAINQGLAMQGKRLDVAEGLRIAFKLYPELISDPSRIIRPIAPEQEQAILSPQAPQQGGDRGGKQEAIRQAPPPNTADLASAAAGEKGQGFPIV